MSVCACARECDLARVCSPKICHQTNTHLSHLPPSLHMIHNIHISCFRFDYALVQGSDFESKGNKMSSSGRTRVRTGTSQAPLASRLNACSQIYRDIHIVCRCKHEMPKTYWVYEKLGDSSKINQVTNLKSKIYIIVKNIPPYFDIDIVCFGTGNISCM